jgi:hypothetical protein
VSTDFVQPYCPTVNQSFNHIFLMILMWKKKLKEAIVEKMVMIKAWMLMVFILMSSMMVTDHA